MRFLVWATTQQRAMHKAATRYPPSRGFKVEVIDEQRPERTLPGGVKAGWGILTTFLMIHHIRSIIRHTRTIGHDEL